MNVYLDNNATTRVCDESLDAMSRCYREEYGNPSSMHSMGMRAKEMMGQARGEVAGMLGASAKEIVFTSGATESIHMAILGACRLHMDKRHIVTSCVEHPSQLALFDLLEKKGYRVSRLGVDRSGMISLEELEREIGEDTLLVSLMWANNETGVIFPVEEAAGIAKSKGVLFHTDAVQAAGKTAIDLSRIRADFLSFSGHKMHAAKGVGVLFARKGWKLSPVFLGHQERGMRGGTENLPAIVGLGVACCLAMDALDESEKRIAALRDRLEQEILAKVKDVAVNGAGAPRISNTSNLSFGNIESEALLEKLDRAGIFASSGAACKAGGTEPSHVLVAMGAEAQSAVRFSLSRHTTDEEIDHVLGILPGIVETMAN